LSRAELDERLTAAYAAKTHADLHDLTSDLPGAVPAPATGDQSLADPESGAGTQLNVCLLLCLLCACPPAGIAYWILTAAASRSHPSQNGPRCPVQARVSRWRRRAPHSSDNSTTSA
jgi:hypothetical protein